MISKKRYWGLALPIYDCAACGTVEVIGGREELQERAVEGWEAFEGHTPHRPYVDAVKIACPGCGEPVERIQDVGNPWLDAGIVPFSTLHFREDPDYWARVVPGRLHHRELPRPVPQLVLLDARDVARCCGASRRSRRSSATPCVFGEDGRPMHKSWGNAIEFDEAAERMGVDVMRWMFAKARPEDNILFGWHAADEARRELLVLWNVYAFFVTYARLAGWTPGRRPAPPVADRPVLDRWILSRAAGTAADGRGPAARRRRASGRRGRCRAFIDGLSTWYLRLSRRRFSRSDDPTDRARGVRDPPRGARRRRARMLAPILPFLTEAMYDNLVAAVDAEAPDSVHLTRWPTAELAAHRDEAPRGRDGDRPGAPSISPGRCAARPASRPVSRWRRPGSRCPDRGLAVGRRAAPAHRRRDQRQGGRAHRRRVRRSSSGGSSRCCRRSASGSGRRSRRSWPPPATGEVTFEADGSVTLGRRDPGARRGRDPGDAAARDGRGPRRRPGRRHRHGADAGAAGRGRRPRAASAPIQDLRSDAGLELDDRIELWVDAAAGGRRAAPARRSPPRRSPSSRTGRAASRTPAGRRSSSTAARSASPCVDGRDGR